MAKGSEFERAICKQLSLWWTHNSRDDIFWRSTTSGARATTRAKKGLKTEGMHGDITHTHPIGQVLMDCISFELKRGYPKATIHDALDYGSKMTDPPWIKMVQQARRSWELSGSHTWALITKRDQRRPMVFIPRSFYAELKTQGAFKSGFFEGSTIAFRTREGMPLTVFGCGWDTFLTEVSPKMIQGVVR